MTTRWMPSARWRINWRRSYSVTVFSTAWSGRPVPWNLIQDVSQALSPLDYDALYEYIARYFEASSVFVGLYDAERGELHFPLSMDERSPVADEQVPLQSLCYALI